MARDWRSRKDAYHYNLKMLEGIFVRLRQLYRYDLSDEHGSTAGCFERDRLAEAISYLKASHGLLRETIGAIEDGRER